jgi:hypothetical protein
MTTATPGLDGTFLTDDHDRTQWVVNRLLDEGW